MSYRIRYPHLKAAGSYLEGENKAAYLEDVQIIQCYAEWNRQIIVREILKGKACQDSCLLSAC